MGTPPFPDLSLQLPCGFFFFSRTPNTIVSHGSVLGPFFFVLVPRDAPAHQVSWIYTPHPYTCWHPRTWAPPGKDLPPECQAPTARRCFPRGAGGHSPLNHPDLNFPPPPGVLFSSSLSPPIHPHPPPTQSSGSTEHIGICIHRQRDGWTGGRPMQRMEFSFEKERHLTPATAGTDLEDVMQTFSFARRQEFCEWMVERAAQQMCLMSLDCTLEHG